MDVLYSGLNPSNESVQIEIASTTVQNLITPNIFWLRPCSKISLTQYVTARTMLTNTDATEQLRKTS